MTHNNSASELVTGKRILILIIILILVSAYFPIKEAYGETNGVSVDRSDSVTLGDLADAAHVADEKAFPVITSVGKKSIKIRGVKSKGKLVKYTVPEQLLKDDPKFLTLMIEAEKYIGYPYVYGAANPDTGFDCSGFVCWVFRQSGVYKLKRVGAKGLYSMCRDIPRQEARPGDLVFFEKTAGPNKTGVTHVGIYVGNNMMIHAGDPVGFADLKSEQWAKKLYAFGRLPID